MRIEAFVADRDAEWRELEALIKRARGRPERLGVTDVARLGQLYRASAADLALARHAFGPISLTRRLEVLTGRARVLVYRAPPRQPSLRPFIAHGYWRAVRGRPRALATIGALMALSTVLASVWALHDPGAALGAVPKGLAAAGNPSSRDPISSAATSAALTSEIFTNNMQVAIEEFAGGLLLGIGAFFIVAYNGLIVGVVIGLAVGNGHSALAAELLVPHGVLELSLNVVCAAAGARIGWAIVEPGPLTRLRALQRESRVAGAVLLGTLPWFVVAGVVEGFVTPHRIGVVPALAVGIALAGLYWGLVWWLGSPAAASEAKLVPVT